MKGANPLGLDSTQYLLLFLLAGIVVPLSYLLVAKACAVISASEVSLLLLGEVLFSPIYVWIVLKDTPPMSDISGAAIIFSRLNIVETQKT